MREITKLMIREFNIKRLGYDFMGFRLNKGDIATYHHLIESKDEEIFNLITSEMIDENIKGYLDTYNLMKINDLLNCFEREHEHDRSKKGKILIKKEYYNRIYKGH